MLSCGFLVLVESFIYVMALGIFKTTGEATLGKWSIHQKITIILGI